MPFLRPFHAPQRPFGLALAALAAAAVSIGAATPAQAVTRCGPDPAWGTNRPDLAAVVVSLVNDYRAEKGLPRLATSSSLTASSEWKSLHMAGKKYFDHADPAPFARSAYQRATECGFDGGSWGENIAAGYTTERSAVGGWLASKGHRANIENPRFTTTGVGVAVAPGGTVYWTQSFGDGDPERTAVGSSADATRDTVSITTKTGLTPTVGQARAVGSPSTSQIVIWVPFVRKSVSTNTIEVIACRAAIEQAPLVVKAKSRSQMGTRCTWKLPASAEGKTIDGVVVFRAGKELLKRPFAVRVG